MRKSAPFWNSQPALAPSAVTEAASVIISGPGQNQTKVMANVRELREQGYFFSRGLVTPGAGSIAMPLPCGIDRRDRPLAVGVSGALDEFVRREEDIVACMRDRIRRFIRLDRV